MSSKQFTRYGSDRYTLNEPAQDTQSSLIEVLTSKDYDLKKWQTFLQKPKSELEESNIQANSKLLSIMSKSIEYNDANCELVFVMD